MDTYIMSWVLLGLGFIISIYAQFKINSAYSKYREIENSKNISGHKVANDILARNELTNIQVNSVEGNLSDHYDPKNQLINLSTDIFSGNSIASIAVAAHECGHAIQKKEGYGFYKMRTALVPVVNLVNYIGYFGLIIACFLGMTRYIELSIVIVLATLIFQLVTLPVEFDASRRVKQQLIEMGVVSNEDMEGVNKVLSAAAFTYVAGVVSSLLSLLRLVLLLNRRRR